MVWDGWNLVATFSGTTAGEPPVTSYGLSKSYLHGEGLLAETNSSGTYLAMADGNKNITAYVDASDGSIVWEGEYSPTGKEIVSTGTKPCGFGFAGYYRDEETGLSYLGYRYYDADTGRFPSRDPIGEDGGNGLYRYGRNDLINGWDYLGMYDYKFASDFNESEKKYVKLVFKNLHDDIPNILKDLKKAIQSNKNLEKQLKNQVQDKVTRARIASIKAPTIAFKKLEIILDAIKKAIADKTKNLKICKSDEDPKVYAWVFKLETGDYKPELYLSTSTLNFFLGPIGPKKRTIAHEISHLEADTSDSVADNALITAYKVGGLFVDPQGPIKRINSHIIPTFEDYKKQFFSLSEEEAQKRYDELINEALK